MSTDTTQDGEDRRLPATWEEFQRARREAFNEGCRWRYAYAAPEASDPLHSKYGEWARSAFPITKRVPREKVIAGGLCRIVVDGRRGVRGSPVLRWNADYSPTLVHNPDFTAADLDEMRDLVANPFEEIPE